MLVAAAASAQEPRSLDECYLRIAAQKSTADAVYVAREICDAVFRPAPRAIAVLGKDGTCTEWWFDHHGRYESPTQYCSLEEMGEGVFRFACQWKGTKSVTYAELREDGDRYAGEIKGAGVGELFRSLGGCIAHKVGVASAPGS
jgi:hypothetical protein